jgi:hypothetical protein
MEPNQTPASAPAKKAPLGGVIAIIVVLVLIVVGALYAWGERIAENGAQSPEEEQVIDELQTQSNSTDPDAIEADLTAQSSEEFDAELDEAFAEMDTAFEAE